MFTLLLLYFDSIFSRRTSPFFCLFFQHRRLNKPSNYTAVGHEIHFVRRVFRVCTLFFVLLNFTGTFGRGSLEHRERLK